MKRPDVAAHYDTLDVWYRALWGDHLHHGLWNADTAGHAESSGNLLRAIATAARLQPGMRVCDVGCGYGGPARWLARETGSAIVALTNSSKQFEAALPANGVEFQLADWLENALPDESFDAVVAIESISHFSEPATAIREMARVLKPGGRIVLATWIIGENVSAFSKWALVDPIRRTGRLHGLADEAAHRRWAGEAGLEVISTERLGARVAPSWSAGMSRALRSLFTDRELALNAACHPLQALRLGLSSIRIWLAYRFEVLDYAIFVIERGRGFQPSGLAELMVDG